MGLRLFSNLLIGVGALLLALTGLYYGYVAFAQFQVAQFPAEERLEPPEGNAPPQGVDVRDVPPVFSPPGPVEETYAYSLPSATHIRIPSIGVDSAIVELGTTYDEKGELVWETPKHAVGHHLGTANPGEAGNAVLSGHISSPIKKEGNVFSRLPQLRLGEAVMLETSQGTFTYRVVSRKIVEPSEVSVMDPTPSPALTLITCFPDWVYTHRLVLTAEPIGFQAHEDQALGNP